MSCLTFICTRDINIANLCIFVPSPLLQSRTTSQLCLHNLFWWRMRTHYAATEINGTRSPRINRYNYRCGQMNCTCGSHAVPRRKVRTSAKLARFPSDLRRLSWWILFLPPPSSFFSRYLVFRFTQRLLVTFPFVIIIDLQNSWQFDQITEMFWDFYSRSGLWIWMIKFGKLSVQYLKNNAEIL